MPIVRFLKAKTLEVRNYKIKQFKVGDVADLTDFAVSLANRQCFGNPVVEVIGSLLEEKPTELGMIIQRNIQKYLEQRKQEGKPCASHHNNY